MHKTFQKATDALKEAFKEALEDDNFDQNTISEVWRHYQGMKRITKDLPKHEHTDNRIFLSDENGMGSVMTTDFSSTYAAGPVHIQGGAGSDVISFEDNLSINTQDGDGTVTFIWQKFRFPI